MWGRCGLLHKDQHHKEKYETKVKEENENKKLVFKKNVRLRSNNCNHDNK